MEAQCAVHKCGKPIYCRTLCRNHYQYFMEMNRKNTKKLTIEEYITLKLTPTPPRKAPKTKSPIGKMEYRIEREHFFL